MQKTQMLNNNPDIKFKKKLSIKPLRYVDRQTYKDKEKKRTKRHKKISMNWDWEGRKKLTGREGRLDNNAKMLS